MKFVRTIGAAALALTLAACSSTPEVSVTYVPNLPHPNVVLDKPAPPQSAQTAIGSCTAEPARIGRPYIIGGVRYVPKAEPGYVATGIASYYGKYHHGNSTANGEQFDMHGYSAAHTTLPLPTCVRVTNLKNNKSIILRVNDRGPFVKGRIIDLSYAAARELDFINAGLTEVRVEAID